MKLSVVIPVYNEAATIKKVIARVQKVDINKEIILVDDFSCDGTRQILMNIEGDGVRVFFHEKNMGKGAALRTGFKHISGDLIIIQDADMEYDPQDYLKLVEPIRKGSADVVYGSRFLNRGYLPHCVRPFYLTHFIGNKMLNFLVYMLYNVRISDMETCYKMLKKEVLYEINLTADRFEIEPEITAQLLRRGYKIHEIPISYKPRDYREGKKISWKDGFIAIYTLLKYRFKKEGFDE